MKKSIKLTVITWVIFTAIYTLGGGWYMSSLVLHPAKTPCNPDHFTYCGTPGEQNIAYEDISFKTADGLTLRGWFMPAAGSAKAVVTIHGHGASRHEGARWWRSLLKSGFNVLTFDLRGCGESDGDTVTMGFLERKDVLVAVDFLEKNKNMKSIGVLGVSMGAASGIPAMAMNERIRAGVFEAGFANLHDEFAEILSRDFGLPAFPLLNASLLILELRSGIDITLCNPEEYIGTIAPRPVFIIHCDGDDYVNINHEKRIFEAARDPKDFWRAGCTKHAEAWQSDPLKAERLVNSFFIKYL